MNTPLTNKPTSLVRQHTQHARDLAVALDRLRDQFYAKLARAQAEYVEGVKRVTDALTHEATAETDGKASEPNGANSSEAGTS